ncbi:MAG: arginyltransferase [Rhizobiales bacterium]|nr:arginyltransferase [Hyphomicrobiales bacterium]MBI3672975.1 arginyltransferase [Hyphomicrobiales bacterium]
MSIERRNFPQFFITAPSPCPYLPGRVERKVFTHLVGLDARALNTQLSQGGFRRSQNIAYRPACEACTACVSVRVQVKGFDPGRRFRRVLASNADLETRVVRPKATTEHFSLFRAYIDARHGDGGMADMTALDFSAMVDDSFVDNRLVEYRLPRGADGTQGALVAAVLIDILGDGMSMIYSFYDPSLVRRSLGTYMILDSIARARKLGLPYLYLGYWVRGSRKMDYKATFLPQERLTSEGWVLHRR